MSDMAVKVLKHNNKVSNSNIKEWYVMGNDMIMENNIAKIYIKIS